MSRNRALLVNLHVLYDYPQLPDKRPEGAKAISPGHRPGEIVGIANAL